MKIAKRCKECGAVMEGHESDICIKCRSEKINDICKLDAYGQKKMQTAFVPYCFEKDRRVIIKGGWLCHKCKHYKGHFK